MKPRQMVDVELFDICVIYVVAEKKDDTAPIHAWSSDIKLTNNVKYTRMLNECSSISSDPSICLLVRTLSAWKKEE